MWEVIYRLLYRWDILLETKTFPFTWQTSRDPFDTEDTQYKTHRHPTIWRECDVGNQHFDRSASSCLIVRRITLPGVCKRQCCSSVTTLYTFRLKRTDMSLKTSAPWSCKVSWISHMRNFFTSTTWLDSKAANSPKIILLASASIPSNGIILASVDNTCKTGNGGQASMLCDIADTLKSFNVSWHPTRRTRSWAHRCEWVGQMLKNQLARRPDCPRLLDLLR